MFIFLKCRRTFVALNGMYLAAFLGYSKAVDPAAALTAITTMCGFIACANAYENVKNKIIKAENEPT